MKLDKDVVLLRTTSGNRLNDFGTLEKITTVLWKIGTLGPFTDEFKANESDPGGIAGRINKQVADLRAAGMIKATEV